jgi:hypothetical protein
VATHQAGQKFTFAKDTPYGVLAEDWPTRGDNWVEILVDTHYMNTALRRARGFDCFCDTRVV